MQLPWFMFLPFSSTLGLSKRLPKASKDISQVIMSARNGLVKNSYVYITIVLLSVAASNKAVTVNLCTQ